MSLTKRPIRCDKKSIRVIDLFAGVGGLSYGFHLNPAFELVLANEYERSMCDAYALNFRETRVIPGDIAKIRFAGPGSVLEESNPRIDIIVGGPPCQAYSTSGKRLLDDPRASLFREYHRVLSELEPNMFIYENVSGLLSMAGGRLIDEIRTLFEDVGYNTEARVLNAVDFGVPQERRRVILVGTKPGVRFQFPEPTHRPLQPAGELFDLPPHRTVADALSDLPLIGPGAASVDYLCDPSNEYQELMRTGASGELKDHSSSNHGEAMIRIMTALPEGGLMKDLPEELRPKSGFPNSYGRLWWNRPSTTITRNFGCPSSARCIHPKVPRSLTTREGARLQSFPDWFQFTGGRGTRNLQIGNAVPPLISSHLARATALALLNLPESRRVA